MLLLIAYMFPFDDVFLILKQTNQQLFLYLEEVFGRSFLVEVVYLVLDKKG